MNIYELLAFTELTRQHFEVFFPINDRGIDCVILPSDFRGRPLKIQIKGSDTHNSLLPGQGRGWYQFRATDLTRTTDFWLFVLQNRDDRLAPEFVIVPRDELHCRLATYATQSNGKYNMYLDIVLLAGEKRMIDDRDLPRAAIASATGGPRDYTEYWNRWDLLRDAARRSEFLYEGVGQEMRQEISNEA
mgnify:CR=1 FL=1